MVEFEPDLRRAAIDDGVDAPVEIGEHMLARVGLIRPERFADGAAIGRPTRREQVPGERMRRNPKAQACRAPRGRDRETVQVGGAGTTRVRGPGQNASASFAAAPLNTALRLRRLRVGNVRDQRVEARAVLGGVDLGYGLRVGRVGAEAVDGLGRKRDEAACAQDRGGPGQPGTVGGQSLGRAATPKHLIRDRSRLNYPRSQTGIGAC